VFSYLLLGMFFFFLCGYKVGKRVRIYKELIEFKTKMVVPFQSMSRVYITQHIKDMTTMSTIAL